MKILWNLLLIFLIPVQGVELDLDNTGNPPSRLTRPLLNSPVRPHSLGQESMLRHREEHALALYGIQAWRRAW